MVDIHPQALVHETARLGAGVTIGPFAVVHEGVQLLDGVHIHGHAHVLSGTTVGERTEVYQGAVLGGDPQDLGFDPATQTNTVIGADCSIRENVTIHRATNPDAPTRVGNNCLLMVGSHVAHDCRLRDRVILCNNALLGGHVEVRDHAFLSGNTVVHQFVRVGEGVMLSGISGIGKDAPPYTLIAERSEIHGLNTVGMRRAGIDGRARLAIKKLYKNLLAATSEKERNAALLGADDLPEINVIRRFFSGESRRGFCTTA